jgi:hypothetical protein
LRSVSDDAGTNYQDSITYPNNMRQTMKFAESLNRRCFGVLFLSFTFVAIECEK